MWGVGGGREGRRGWDGCTEGPPMWIIEIQLVLFILTTDNCTKLPKAQTCFTLPATLDGASLSDVSASVSCSKSCIGTLQRFGCFR